MYLSQTLIHSSENKVSSLTNISGQCKRDGNICSNMTSLAKCSQSLSHSSSQQQITGFQSMKPTPTDCSCVHITLISQSIHNGANRLSDNHFEQFETRMVFVIYSTVIKYFHKVTYTCHIYMLQIIKQILEMNTNWSF